MEALVVVEVEVARQAVARLFRAVIVEAIDLLIFDGAPEPLGKDVVQGAAFPVHADLDIFFSK